MSTDVLDLWRLKGRPGGDSQSHGVLMSLTLGVTRSGRATLASYYQVSPRGAPAGGDSPLLGIVGAQYPLPVSARLIRLLDPEHSHDSRSGQHPDRSQWKPDQHDWHEGQSPKRRTIPGDYVKLRS